MTRSGVTGLDKTITNLRKEVEKIEGATSRGLLRGAIIIRRESQRLCPVVTGNLKASAYIIDSSGEVKKQSGTFKGKKAAKASTQHSKTLLERKAIVGLSQMPLVEVGYTAVYAARVHENPRAGITLGEDPSGRPYKRTKTGRRTWSVVGQWKFLETAINNNEAKILRVIAEEAKIK